MNHPIKHFSIKREFNATRLRVFNAFSTSEAMADWWGPTGTKITVLSFDFKPGGKFHYKLEGNGQVMWGLFVFKTINKPEMMEYVSSFADENGNITIAPFAGLDFPLEVWNHLDFKEVNGTTTITLQSHAINATDAQEKVFNSLTQSMNDGYNGTLNQLEEYLKKTGG